MIFLDDDCFFKVNSGQETPAIAAHHGVCWWRHQECGEILQFRVEIRFNRLGVPVGESSFNFCDLGLFEDASLLKKSIVPHMFGWMAREHGIFFSDQETRERWELWLFGLLFAETLHARDQCWEGLVVVVDVDIPNSSGEDEDDEELELELALEQLSEEEVYGVPAPESAIYNLKKRVFHGGEGSCLVCLENFEVGDELREMPCAHEFHGECIVRWLRHSGFCPLCRFNLEKEGGVGEEA